MVARRTPFSLSNLKKLRAGRVPGQVILQFTDRCNARCPQCEMRVQNVFARSTLDVDLARRTIDAAAKRGVQALSFTGGEPFMERDNILALIRHASAAGIPYIRTGTNGFMFLGADKPSFEGKVRKFAEELAATEIYTFWISIDSVDDAVHEAMRGLPGVLAGIDRAIPILHEHGIYPSANLGINRNLAGDWAGAPAAARPGEGYDPRAFHDYFLDGFRRFYRKVTDLGFTIVNMCYPMSVEPGTHDGLSVVYSASSTDEIVRFRPDEKLPLFQALAAAVPEFRSQVRIFTPLSSVQALLRQYGGHGKPAHACRGGIDFFFVSAADGNTYPCGFRGQDNLGPLADLDLATLDARENCTRCDWECFRDPSELLGPALEFLAHPLATTRRMLADRPTTRTWWDDVRYYRACEYFCGRKPPNYRKLAAFGASTSAPRPC